MQAAGASTTANAAASVLQNETLVTVVDLTSPDEVLASLDPMEDTLFQTLLERIGGKVAAWPSAGVLLGGDNGWDNGYNEHFVAIIAMFHIKTKQGS